MCLVDNLSTPRRGGYFANGLNVPNKACALGDEPDAHSSSRVFRIYLNILVAPSGEHAIDRFSYVGGFKNFPGLQNLNTREIGPGEGLRIWLISDGNNSFPFKGRSLGLHRSCLGPPEEEHKRVKYTLLGDRSEERAGPGAVLTRARNTATAFRCGRVSNVESDPVEITGSKASPRFATCLRGNLAYVGVQSHFAHFDAGALPYVSTQ